MKFSRLSAALLLVLSLLALAFPAVLQAGSASATGVAPTLAQSADWADVVKDVASPPRPKVETAPAENIAMCAATGFAGGLTLFLCLCGWGVLRPAMSRDAAVGALLMATAASAAGFILGFSGFLDVISY